MGYSLSNPKSEQLSVITSKRIWDDVRRGGFAACADAVRKNKDCGGVFFFCGNGNSIAMMPTCQCMRKVRVDDPAEDVGDPKWAGGGSLPSCIAGDLSELHYAMLPELKSEKDPNLAKQLCLRERGASAFGATVGAIRWHCYDPKAGEGGEEMWIPCAGGFPIKNAISGASRTI